MTPLLTAFTWIGGFVCACGAVMALCWLLEKTVNYVFRTLGWMGPLLRFVWLDGKQKQKLREDVEREQRKRNEQP